MRTTAQIFKALSDETRLRIMSLLIEGRELCVCDIMAVLKLPQSTVSRHLSYLRNAGLVSGRRQGVWMYYQVDLTGSVHSAPLITLLGEMMEDSAQALVEKRSLEFHLEEKENNLCALPTPSRNK